MRVPRTDAKSLVYLWKIGHSSIRWRVGPDNMTRAGNPDFAGKAGQAQCLHVYNQDGMFTMLQLKVIGIACFLLLFFSFAVYAMVKMTEREHKKN